MRSLRFVLVETRLINKCTLKKTDLLGEKQEKIQEKEKVQRLNLASTVLTMCNLVLASGDSVSEKQ